MKWEFCNAKVRPNKYRQHLPKVHPNRVKDGKEGLEQKRMEKRKARKGKDLVVLFWRGDEDDFAILQKVKDEAPEIYIYSLKEMMSREFNSYLNALIGLEFLNFKEFAEADTDGEENGVCLYNP